MYGTTARDRPYVNRSRRQKINAADFMRYPLAHSATPSPDGKVLELILTSMFDPSSKTGVMNPTVPRLMALTGFDEIRLAAAVADLESSGQWTTCRDSRGRPTNYLPSFYREVGDQQQILRKNVLGTKDHVTWLTRYGNSAGLTTVQIMAFVMATSTIRPVWNLLGADKGPIVHRSPGGGKLVQGALFSHQILSDQTPSGWQHLAETPEVPEDINSKSAIVPLGWLARKVGVSVEELIGHLRRPCELFTVRPWRDGKVLIVPTIRFHQLVWEFYRRPAGPERSAWERAQGLYPTPAADSTSNRLMDSYGSRPPLGFHWLYEVVEVDGDGNEVVLFVGETTQSLEARLAQHLQSPSNNDAHRHIQSMLREGEAPRIRPVSMVHYYETAIAEIELLQWHLSQGCHLKNYIDNVADNNHTVARDSRFSGYPEELVTGHLDYWRDHTPPADLIVPRIPSSGTAVA